MKLGIISSITYRKTAGGTNAFLRDFVKYSYSELQDIILVGITDDRKEMVNQWSYREIDGHKIPFLPFAYISSQDSIIPQRLKCMVGFFKRSFKLINDKAEIIYIHSPELVVPYVFFNRSMPLVYHMHGAFNPLTYSKYNWFRKKILTSFFDKTITYQILKRANTAVGINTDCLRLCRSVKQDSSVGCKKIPTSVDTRIFYPNRADHTLTFEGNKSHSTIIYVGRLGKAKGLSLLLEAFSIVVKNVNRTTLVIAGDGEEKNSLVKLSENFGLKDSVQFLGRKSHDSIPNLLNSADVFVMTSHAEGVPIALLEAMACGLPVVSVNTGGISEVIKDGENGYLIQTRDPSILAEKIIDALIKRKTLGKKAVTTINKYYSSEKVSRRLLRVLQDVSS